MDIDTRLLRCFVAVAEERGFTKAAHRLFESQPTVTRQIQRLEELVRTPLFTRAGGAVRLTPAGTALLPSAQRVVEEWAAALSATRAAVADTARTLRVGYAVTGAGAVMAAAQAAFGVRHPGVVVTPKRLPWGAETRALAAGEADLAYVWLPADTTGCHTQIVDRQPLLVGLPTAHPLAGRAELRTAELGAVPARAVCAAAGGRLRWWPAGQRPVGPVDDVDELLDCVAAGVAVCVAPVSVAARCPRPTVIWLPLRDAEPLRVALAWRSGRRNPLLPAFAAVVRELVRSRSAAGRSPAEVGRVETGRHADRLPGVHIPAHRVQVGADLLDGVHAQRQP